jgi:AraC-like DNA-binding protein
VSFGPEVFRRLCAARQLLIDDSDRAPLPIDAVARAIGMSPFHFIRRFDAVFGVTPHQARIAARLDRAKLLLARGEHSVTEVCFEVGFSSLGSFSALFARRVGESPSEFRRRVRRVVSVPGTLPAAREAEAIAAAFPSCLMLMRHLPVGAFRSFREASPG